MIPRRTLILGSAGRDFHVFATVFRSDPRHEVLGFTSSALSAGERGVFPSCLCGDSYPAGIPIIAEADLERFVASERIEKVVFAYAEIRCTGVAAVAARVLAAGADFQLLSPNRSMLTAQKPVIAVSSAHTGAGKTPTVRHLTDLLLTQGVRVAVLRHPVQRSGFTAGWQHQFSDDEPGLDACARPQSRAIGDQPGAIRVDGLDHAAVLAAAEEQADVILWDSAGTDLPFVRADLHLVLVDPLRADAGLDCFPGEVTLRLADAVIISKCDAVSDELVQQSHRQITRLNPGATVFTADSPVVIDHPERIAGRTVVVVEEEPTLAFGDLRPGAGIAAAHAVGVSAIISPLPQAVGSLVAVYACHPEAQSVLPVADREPATLADVRATAEATPSEAVIDATTLGLDGLFDLGRPVAKAGYALRPHDPDALAALVLERVRPR